MVWNREEYPISYVMPRREDPLAEKAQDKQSQEEEENESISSGSPPPDLTSENEETTENVNGELTKAGEKSWTEKAANFVENTLIATEAVSILALGTINPIPQNSQPDRNRACFPIEQQEKKPQEKNERPTGYSIEQALRPKPLNEQLNSVTQKEFEKKIEERKEENEASIRLRNEAIASGSPPPDPTPETDENESQKMELCSGSPPPNLTSETDENESQKMELCSGSPPPDPTPETDENERPESELFSGSPPPTLTSEIKENETQIEGESISSKESKEVNITTEITAEVDSKESQSSESYSRESGRG